MGSKNPTAEEWAAMKAASDRVVNCPSATLAALATRDAEIAKLKRQLVWAVRGCMGITIDGKQIVCDEYVICVHFDGTDAGLLAAIDEVAP